MLEETAKALKNTKIIEAKFAEQISNKLIRKVEVEITSFQDLRMNWIGPLRNLIAEINSRKSWNNPNEMWQKENTYKIQLSNTERKMGDMLEYHRQADSEIILLFLDVQIKFHKEAYLSYKDFKDNIVQKRGQELHKSQERLNRDSKSRDSLSKSQNFESCSRESVADQNFNQNQTLPRSKSTISRKYEPHPPNTVFRHEPQPQTSSYKPSPPTTLPRPKSGAFSEASEAYYSARNSVASNSSKRLSKAEDPSAQLSQRISDQAKIHKQAEQTDSGTQNVYKLSRKPQMLNNSNGLRRTATNYNMRHHITGPIKPIHFDPENSENLGDSGHLKLSRAKSRTPTATNGKYCRALFAHHGRNQNELSFERSEVIEILNTNEGKLTHFGRTVKDSRFGSFPINVVEII